jgi:hypothetical protein
MSSQVSETLQPALELNNNPMPPRATPSPDAAESGLFYLSGTLVVKVTHHNPSELKLSRKREREVSVEPVTTPTASNVLKNFVFLYLCTDSKSLVTGCGPVAQ